MHKKKLRRENVRNQSLTSWLTDSKKRCISRHVSRAPYPRKLVYRSHGNSFSHNWLTDDTQLGLGVFKPLGNIVNSRGILSYDSFAWQRNVRNKLSRELSVVQSTRDAHATRDTPATLLMLHTASFFSWRRCFRNCLYAIMARSLSLSALSRSRADMCLRFLVFGSPGFAGVLICAFVSMFVSCSCDINEWSNSVFDPWNEIKWNNWTSLLDNSHKGGL